MKIHFRLAFLGAAVLLGLGVPARAQTRPYIGYAYPAGGRQGTTFQVKLGGQGLEDVNRVLVTGAGVTGKVVDYFRPLGAQEITLLTEQLRELKRGNTNASGGKTGGDSQMMAPDTMMMMGAGSGEAGAAGPGLIGRLEKRIAETVARPASAALASIVFLEVRIDPDAEPGPRELRLGTLKGLSNPLVFHVGQLPESTRKAMVTSPLQVLGKEELALRKRPAAEAERRIELPCTLNGQVASGELNRYRFSATKGQKLVMTTQARQLIPFIADAVPGWFQPVLAVFDGQGKEVAYADDDQFKPDPTILFEVPADGEYVLAIYDAIYRGREDFVYRISIGEIPWVTHHFPLGGPAGAAPEVALSGWNLQDAQLSPPPAGAGPGTWWLNAASGGLYAGRVAFALDTFPETLEQGGNNDPAHAQKVTLPVVINGRIDRPGDWDVFRFMGKSNDVVVAEVLARRLESPLDSVLKLTGPGGAMLAFNDDSEEATTGVNTHPADSRLSATLPADGTYSVHVSDTARAGGENYAYRLRLGAPQPDFALRTVPSSASLRGKGNTTVSVHLLRKDGFAGPVKIGLKNPPPGFAAAPITLAGTQTVARLTLRCDLPKTDEPERLTVSGTAQIDGREVVRESVPSEDRMQAFLWRHLVAACDFPVLVFDANYQAPPKRVARVRPPAEKPAESGEVSTNAAPKPKFTKQQVAGRLRQLKFLFEEGLLTDDFYERRVEECEAVQ